MNALRLGADLELDVCRDCGLVWLDRGEQERLPQRSSAEIEDDERGMDQFLGVSVAAEEGMRFRPGMSPYENVKGERPSSLPFVTILLICAFALVTKLALANDLEGYVFHSAQPLQGWGIPALLSLFAHANMDHLIGNSLFFFLPAAVLEATLGELVLLQVFFLAGFAGTAVQSFAQPGSSMLGASGAISGVFTVLCLTQPRAVQVSQNLLLVNWSSFVTVTSRIPMPLVYAGWLAQQFYGGFMQRIGEGDGIGYGAHLGGALAGLLYVFFSDLQVLGPGGSTPPRSS
jgi:membrane associated rhomboid family serine protease